MKKIVLFLGIAFFAHSNSFAQSIIELEPSQSMSITGKGPGQDAAINPFSGSECIAIVQNIGKNDFDIRIQQNDEIIKTITVKKGENANVQLLKGQELYFDSEMKAKAKVEFAQIEG